MKRFIPFLIVLAALNIFVASVKAAQIKVTDYFTEPKEIAMAAAAAGNDASRIRELKVAGVDVNVRGRGNLTPILLAITSHNKKAYECLLELGADPNVQFQETGSSALSTAAAMADSSYLEQALEHGGKPNQVNPTTGLPPIWRSIGEMLPDNVRLLAAAGADVNFADGNGVTLLMLAAAINRYDIDLILLNAGADPGRRNKWGNSLLLYIHHNRADPHSKFFEWKEQVVERLRKLGIDTEHAT